MSADHRRQGIGSALMRQAEAWARAHGADEVELGVWEFSDEALAFYSALGYVTSRRTMHRRLVLGRSAER